MTSNDATLIERIRQRSREQLLHMRAEGDDLADEWHDAIEAVFAERGESPPPRPSQPIKVMPARVTGKGDAFLAGSALLIAIILGGMLKNSWLAFPLGTGAVVFYVFRWLRRQAMPLERREQEIAEKQADALGLNELMRCASDGDVARVRELLEYAAADVNARSKVGATALVYAARNGHVEIVDLLLAHGARRDVTTAKGASALSIARQFGHDDIAAKLELSH